MAKARAALVIDLIIFALLLATRMILICMSRKLGPVT
jgi:hypothetical protein